MCLRLHRRRNLLGTSFFFLMVCMFSFEGKAAESLHNVGATSGSVSSSQNQTAAIFRVLIFDFRVVLEKLAVMQKTQKEIDKYTAFYQEKFTEQNEKIRLAYDALNAQEKKLPLREAKRRKEQLESELQKLQNSVEQKRRAINKAFKGILSTVEREVKKNLALLRKKYAADLVLKKEVVLLFSNNVKDITDEILQLLEKKLKALTIKLKYDHK
jgi:Skp family chaperone for outer membrane proteins